MVTAQLLRRFTLRLFPLGDLSTTIRAYNHPKALEGLYGVKWTSRERTRLFLVELSGGRGQEVPQNIPTSTNDTGPGRYSARTYTHTHTQCPSPESFGKVSTRDFDVLRSSLEDRVGSYTLVEDPVII